MPPLAQQATVVALTSVERMEAVAQTAALEAARAAALEDEE
jgi:hypothetical protein